MPKEWWRSIRSMALISMPPEQARNLMHVSPATGRPSPRLVTVSRAYSGDRDPTRRRPDPTISKASISHGELDWSKRHLVFEKGRARLSARPQSHRQRGLRSRSSFYENDSCNSERNLTNYCTKRSTSCSTINPRRQTSPKRKKLVGEIDHKLQEELARPIIFHGRMVTGWSPM